MNNFSEFKILAFNGINPAPVVHGQLRNKSSEVGPNIVKEEDGIHPVFFEGLEWKKKWVLPRQGAYAAPRAVENFLHSREKFTLQRNFEERR